MTRSILLAGAALISVSISPLNAEASEAPQGSRRHFNAMLLYSRMVSAGDAGEKAIARLACIKIPRCF